MSKKSVVQRDKKRRLAQRKYVQLRRYINGKIQRSFSVEEKIFYSSLMQKLPRNSSKTRSL